MADSGLDIIVFDCDGVLLESVDIKTEAFACCVQEHGPEAAALLVEYHLAHGGVSRYEKFRYFYRAFHGREITQPEMDALERRFRDSSLAGVMQAPAVPGAVEFLRAYHGRWPFYIASGAPQVELHDIFAQRGLAGYFERIYGSPTPKHEILANILRETGVPAERALMVGDSSTDLEAAQAVGMRFLGRGPFPAPWPWIEDLTGLPDFLERDHLKLSTRC